MICVPRLQKKKEKMSRVPYASAVSSLMYVMICTRPDICYAIGLVSRYQSKALDDSQEGFAVSKRNFILHVMLPKEEGFVINRLF